MQMHDVFFGSLGCVVSGVRGVGGLDPGVDVGDANPPRLGWQGLELDGFVAVDRARTLRMREERLQQRIARGMVRYSEHGCLLVGSEGNALPVQGAKPRRVDVKCR